MLPMEIENRSLYGFLFDTRHTLYYLSTDGYRLVKVLDDVDPDKDRVSIMANMFYWTVAKTTPDGEHTYALESRSMQRVDSPVPPGTGIRVGQNAALPLPVHGNLPRQHEQLHLSPGFGVLLPVTPVEHRTRGRYPYRVLQRQIPREIPCRNHHPVHGNCRIHHRMSLCQNKKITLNQ